MEPASTIAAISGAVKLMEKAYDLIKKYSTTLPAGAIKTEAEGVLKETDEHLKTAKAKLGESFGFPLCKRHFPPGVLIQIGSTWNGEWQWQCIECQVKHPTDETLQEEQKTAEERRNRRSTTRYF